MENMGVRSRNLNNNLLVGEREDGGGAVQPTPSTSGRLSRWSSYHALSLFSSLS